MKKIAISRTCLAVTLILLCLAPAAHAARTDVVGLLNGDDVTGEIKSLEFGELRYGTDSMGTVSIEWEEVVALSTGRRPESTRYPPEGPTEGSPEDDHAQA